MLKQCCRNFAQENAWLTGVILVGLGAFLISFSPVFVQLSHTGPTADAFYRMWFGGLGLLFVAILRKERLFGGMRLAWLWLIAAFCMGLDLLCWHRSIAFVGPGLATILGNFQVFFLFLFSIFFYKERFSLGFFIAVVLALLGLTLIVGIQPALLPANYGWGIVLGLATAFFYAIYTLVLRKSQMVPEPLPVIANLAWVSLVCAGMLFIAAQIEGASLHLATSYDWVCLISYGLVSQLLGWMLISSGLPRISLSLGGLLILLQPTFAFLWDVVFFERPTTKADIIGAVLTLLALYLGFMLKSRQKVV